MNHFKRKGRAVAVAALLVLAPASLFIAPATVQARAYQVGQQVRVLWQGKWYDARILRLRGNRYYVHYVGYAASWDEWVTADRIRAGATQPKRPARPSRPSTTTTTGGGGGLIVTDRHGRSLLGRVIPLVDWDGNIANPVVELHIRPRNPAFARGGYVRLSTTHPRLLFASAGRSGSTTVSTIGMPRGKGKLVQYVSLFHDSDTRSETGIELRIKYIHDSAPLHAVLRFREVDQDRNSGGGHAILLDFSQDARGFFGNRQRAAIKRAARDWGYFLANMNVDRVAAGAQSTYVYSSRRKGRWVRNARPYTGTLLYATSIQQPGNIQTAAFAVAMRKQHTSGGRKLGITRSGSVMFDVDASGLARWSYLAPGDYDRWHRQVSRQVLHITARHEIGHALGFSNGNAIWKKFRSSGAVRDERVRAYYGSYPKISSGAHVIAIDPASRFPAYGYAGGGKMPPGLATITKLDLLILQSIGYRLRRTSAFAGLRLGPGRPHAAVAGQAYLYRPRIRSGTPPYYWRVRSGRLPAGLTLDSFTGEVRGTPRESGHFTVGLELSHTGGAERVRPTYRLAVRPGAGRGVVRHYAGVQTR